MAKAQKFTRAQLDAAMRKAYWMYHSRSNFTGIDVGYKWEGDSKTEQQVVRIHVTEKRPVSELAETEVFPSEIDGIPLDVIEGPYRASLSLGSPRKRNPFLMGGLSVGRLDNSAGTLGALVINEESGRPALLSNWHVLAGANAMVGDAILQPGRADGGMSGDAVAELTRWLLGLDGDAAIAELTGQRPWLPIQFENFATFTGTRNSRLNEVLVKQGRTTGHTSARVDGEGIYRVAYEVRPGQIEPRDIQGFKLVPEQLGNPDDIEVSEGGDSGSVWYNPSDQQAVGLHFAGESVSDPLAERAIACNMPRVLERLEARLATYDDLMTLAAETEAMMVPQGDWGIPRSPCPPMPHPGWSPRGPLHWPPVGPLPPRPPIYDMRDPRFTDPRSSLGDVFTQPTVNAMSYRAEQAGTGIPISITGHIWPMLRNGLVRTNPGSGFASAGLADKVSDFVQVGDERPYLTKAMNTNPDFPGNAHPSQLPRGMTFHEAAIWFSGFWTPPRYIVKD